MAQKLKTTIPRILYSQGQAHDLIATSQSHSVRYGCRCKQCEASDPCKDISPSGKNCGRGIWFGTAETELVAPVMRVKGLNYRQRGFRDVSGSIFTCCDWVFPAKLSWLHYPDSEALKARSFAFLGIHLYL